MTKVQNTGETICKNRQQKQNNRKRKRKGRKGKRERERERKGRENATRIARSDFIALNSNQLNVDAAITLGFGELT